MQRAIPPMLLQAFCGPSVSTAAMRGGEISLQYLQPQQCAVAVPRTLLQWGSGNESYTESTLWRRSGPVGSLPGAQAPPTEQAATDIWLHGLYVYSPSTFDDSGSAYVAWRPPRQARTARLWLTDVTLVGGYSEASGLYLAEVTIASGASAVCARYPVLVLRRKLATNAIQRPCQCDHQPNLDKQQSTCTISRQWTLIYSGHQLGKGLAESSI